MSKHSGRLGIHLQAPRAPAFHPSLPSLHLQYNSSTAPTQD